MLKKLILIILGFFIIYTFVYLTVINIVNLIYFKHIKYIFDYHLLFFNNDDRLFKVATISATAIYFIALINILFTSKKDKNNKNHSKRKLTEEELSREAKLNTISFYKKIFLRLKIDKKSKLIKYDIIDELTRLKKEIIFKRFVKLEKKIKELFKLNPARKIFFLTEFNYKHRLFKSWNNNFKKTYKRGGIPVITYSNEVYVDEQDSHTIILGTSGSGKSWSLVLGMINLISNSTQITKTTKIVRKILNRLSLIFKRKNIENIDDYILSGENILVNDPKGELYEATRQLLIERGYNVIPLNFVNTDFSVGWNPFDPVIDEWKKALKKAGSISNEQQKSNKNNLDYFLSLGFDIDDIPLNYTNDSKVVKADFSKSIELITDIANIMYIKPNVKDPIWQETARDMLVGYALILLEEGLYDYLNFANIEKLYMSFNEMGLKKETKLKQYFDRKPNSLAREKLKTYIDSQKSQQTMGSFQSSFSNGLSIAVANQGIKTILANNDIDFKKIVEEKTAIFLIVHDEKKTYHALATMFVKQLYESLISASRNYKRRRLPIAWNFILDEFGNMPALKDIDTMLTAARSRGIRLFMILQDFEQLVETYGQSVAATIRSNVMNVIYLLSGSEKTLKEISNLVGNKFSWNLDKKLWEYIPAFSPERLKSFQLGEALFIFQRLGAFYTKLLGYDEYKFFKKSTFDKEKTIYKKPVEYYDFNELM